MGTTNLATANPTRSPIERAINRLDAIRYALQQHEARLHRAGEWARVLYERGDVDEALALIERECSVAIVVGGRE